MTRTDIRKASSVILGVIVAMAVIILSSYFDQQAGIL
jgi:hypothetical protein